MSRGKSHASEKEEGNGFYEPGRELRLICALNIEEKALEKYKKEGWGAKR